MCYKLTMLYYDALFLVAPTLPHPPKDRTFFIGTVSFLECGVSNKTFPPPTVRWYKSEDEVLSESEEIINGSAEGKFFISPNTKTLLIADSEITDGSTYRCFVANAAGNVTSLGGQLTFESGSDGTYVSVYCTTLNLYQSICLYSSCK